MTKRQSFAFILIYAIPLVASQVHAGNLQTRAGGAFLYDPDSDVTWVSDWNLAWSTNYDDIVPFSGGVEGSGKMTWEAANNWVSSLNLAGSNGWRLPSVNVDTSCYYSFPRPADALSRCTSGELSTLWTSSLGGDYSDRPGELANQDQVMLFDNMQSNGFYWTASLNEQDLSGNSAYSFSTTGVYSVDQFDFNDRLFTVAVHDGDIAANLPEPAIPAPTLESRRGGLFLYDPVHDKTWLADANQAFNSSYRSVSTGRTTGEMTYEEALQWADQLVIDGIDGWRLPEVTAFDQPCRLNTSTASTRLESCTEGDFNELWVEILLNGYSDRLMETSQLADARLFDHWQAGNYWTSTLNPLNPNGGSALVFSTFGDYQIDSLNDLSFVIAVRDGDVGENMNVVPVPGAVWLFGTALIGLVGFSQRRKII